MFKSSPDGAGKYTWPFVERTTKLQEVVSAVSKFVYISQYLSNKSLFCLHQWLFVFSFGSKVT